MPFSATVRLERAPLLASFTCPLCGKLFHEATTIIECLHTFCKKCIHEVLQDRQNVCPTCNANLGTNPLEKLRSDNQLAELRSKLFPLDEYPRTMPERQWAEQRSSVPATEPGLWHAGPDKKRAKVAHPRPLPRSHNQLGDKSTSETVQAALSPLSDAIVSCEGTTIGDALQRITSKEPSAVTMGADAELAPEGASSRATPGCRAHSSFPDLSPAGVPDTVQPDKQAVACEKAELSPAQSGRILSPSPLNSDSTLTPKPVELSKKLLNPVLSDTPGGTQHVHTAASRNSQDSDPLHSNLQDPRPSDPQLSLLTLPLSPVNPLESVVPPLPSFKSMYNYVPPPNPFLSMHDFKRMDGFPGHSAVDNQARDACRLSADAHPPSADTFSQRHSPPCNLAAGAPASQTEGPLPTDGAHMAVAEAPGSHLAVTSAEANEVSRGMAASSPAVPPPGSGPRGGGMLRDAVCVPAAVHLQHLVGGRQVPGQPHQRQAPADGGVWIMLQPSQVAGLKYSLPSVARPYIRIRDVSMTVESLRRYLLAKLGRKYFFEIDIMCQGQLLVSHLTLADVKRLWSSIQMNGHAKGKKGVDDADARSIVILTYKRASPHLESPSSEKQVID